MSRFGQEDRAGQLSAACPLCIFQGGGPTIGQKVGGRPHEPAGDAIPCFDLSPDKFESHARIILGLA